MFGSLGFPEIIFILLIVLLIFGPKRLPEIGRTLGRGLGEFRRATNDLKRSIETEVSSLEEPTSAAEPSDAPSPLASVPQASVASPDKPPETDEPA